MKYPCLLSLVIFSLVMTSYIQSTVDQDVDTKLNTLQQAVATLITQSNIDPETAQDLLNKTNELNQYLQNNIQQDVKEIRIAAGLNSITETIDKIAQKSNQLQAHAALSTVKYAARANVMHKLLVGMYPGQFKNQPYYTDPYIESFGFICNDWVFNALFTALLTAIAPTALGTALQLDSSILMKKGVIHIAAGLAAHYAWLSQKKLALSQLST